jgi:hypothetical protein
MHAVQDLHGTVAQESGVGLSLRINPSPSLPFLPHITLLQNYQTYRSLRLAFSTSTRFRVGAKHCAITSQDSILEKVVSGGLLIRLPQNPDYRCRIQGLTFQHTFSPVLGLVRVPLRHYCKLRVPVANFAWVRTHTVSDGLRESTFVLRLSQFLP